MKIYIFACSVADCGYKRIFSHDPGKAVNSMYCPNCKTRTVFGLLEEREVENVPPPTQAPVASNPPQELIVRHSDSV